MFDKNDICCHAGGEDRGCIMCCYGGIPEHVEPKNCGKDVCEWFEKQKPDMREKVKEYISELNVEINRCHKLAEQNMEDESTTLAEMMLVRIQTLTEVKNDLQGRLDELV